MNTATGLFVGFILTLALYSYVWRDNPLFRLAVHILVGVSGAYSVVIVWQMVIWPFLVAGRRAPGVLPLLAWLVPLVLALLLLLKLWPAFDQLGSNVMAFLFAVGAAVALVGAIQGTLLPQAMAAANGAGIGLVSALLVACTLLYFQFTRWRDRSGRATEPAWQRMARGIGKTVIVITLAALFAGTLTTSLVILADRLAFWQRAVAVLLGLVP